ncbi:MAG TPA: right-handed parallel beta-helix repeat-containing protein [Fimbriimonadaceae bacterium]|nr:right-handed parallel beta-helix repeat-containing protein [Fimbriimonadaceae bacterium]
MPGLLFAAAIAQGSGLTPGMVITQSTTMRPGTYRIETNENLQTPALTVRGNNITVDFKGAILEGTPQTTEPNARKGLGVRVEGRNVTIKNLTVRGYKVGLLARNVPGIRITGSDFSYNWKQRLLSTLEREDTADWMSYHRNEKDEWLRYGAGIYLRGCDGFEVDHNRIVGGQNGLMLTECNKGKVWNNNFSFLSSVSLLMYLSSDNKIMHNKMDWAVRGYSHGVYNRGQDSAGIIIYEQSNRNVFAYNSVTHGGDGFFLWAGQTTMDTGKGGCNDNLLFGNDWSHAPTNGIEATFSRNNFVNNLILECWHGIWGGYSWESKVIGNVFGLNAEAIAWEHGQDNLVEHNVFHRDNTGLVIWSNPSQDPNWGYPKNRDTRSRDWTIRNNVFSHIPQTALAVRRTQGVVLEGNRFLSVADIYRLGELVSGFRLGPGNTSDGLAVPAGVKETEQPGSMTYQLKAIDASPILPATMQPSGNLIMGLDLRKEDYLKRFDVPWNSGIRGMGPRTGDAGAEARRAAAVSKFWVQPMKGGMDPFLKKGETRGRRYILVDEWGPYDFKSPRLWPRGEVAAASSVSVDAAGRQTGPSRSTVQRFEVLAPPGRWRVVEHKGVDRVEPTQGSSGQYLDVTLTPGQASDISLVLEYTGAETVDYRGIVTKAGTPVRFGYSKFFAPIDWTISWYAWDRATVADPKANMPALRDLIKGEPLHTVRRDRLEGAWGGSPAPGVPADGFATIATGSFQIAPGEYVLSVTTDDGVRVWVDDNLVLESWKYQGPTNYETRLKLGGPHKIRVEHYEIDGYSALKVELKRP